MSRALFCTIWLTLAVPASAQTGESPTAPEKILLRSGHVTMCQLNKGCAEETLGGRKYLVMKTDGFLLKVASGADQHHAYADVTITNETDAPQQVNPANFRMEESEPRLHRLFYVDPNRQQPVLVREPKPAPSNLGKGLPPPEFWTSEEHEQEKKVKPVLLPVSNVPTLAPSLIASGGTVSGRVYFDRPRTTTGVSLFLALPGALFEFPCQLVVEQKSRKHRKVQPSVEEAETKS